jgi:simple sugar transport system permease protein
MVNISDFNSVGLFAAAIRLATPIIYAGLGGMFSERVGIVNIGLEGTMLTSAFTGVVASYYTGNPWIGVLVSVITGALVSLILAVLTIKYAGDQIISGTGINIMALGFTSYMTQIIWGNRGASDGVQGISDIAIPIVKDIPMIGPIFGTHSPLVYLMPLVVYAGGHHQRHAGGSGWRIPVPQPPEPVYEGHDRGKGVHRHGCHDLR